MSDLPIWMVFWQIGEEFYFRLYFNKGNAETYLIRNRIADISKGYKLMQLTVGDLPELFICSRKKEEDTGIDTAVFLDAKSADLYLEMHDRGNMEVLKRRPGDEF